MQKFIYNIIMPLNAFKLQLMELSWTTSTELHHVSNQLSETHHWNDISNCLPSGQLKRAATIVTGPLACPAAKRRRKKDLEICGKCHKIVAALALQMIQCDNCDQWYQYDCVGVLEEEADVIEFICPSETCI